MESFVQRVPRSVFLTLAALMLVASLYGGAVGYASTGAPGSEVVAELVGSGEADAACYDAQAFNPWSSGYGIQTEAWVYNCNGYAQANYIYLVQDGYIVDSQRFISYGNTWAVQWSNCWWDNSFSGFQTLVTTPYGADWSGMVHRSWACGE